MEWIFKNNFDVNIIDIQINGVIETNLHSEIQFFIAAEYSCHEKVCRADVCFFLYSLVKVSFILNILRLQQNSSLITFKQFYFQ